MSPKNIFAAIIMISMITVCRTSPAQTVSSPNDRQPVRTGPVASASAERAGPENEATERGLSRLWCSYLWQSLPTENLKGPNPDPVSEAYLANDWKPFFIDSRFELNQAAKDLLSRLGTLEKDAIDSGPFKLDKLSQSIGELHQSRSGLKAADPGYIDIRADSLMDAPQSATSTDRSMGPAAPKMTNSEAILQEYQKVFRSAADADVRLTTAFLLLAMEMDPYFQKEEAQKALLGEVPVSKFFKELEPKTFGYEALLSAYGRYKKLAASDAPQRVAISSKPRYGESGNHIRDLQKRLQQEGFYSGNFTGTYDSVTQGAVKEFQKAHLLDPDGVLGQQTVQWLNVSFQQKADLIAWAMKAERQSPSRQFDRFIRINIPRFMLEYYKEGQLREAHRIVVGKVAGKKVKFRGKMVGENQTPTMTSSIQQIILNPRWYVNDRIQLELASQAKSDPEWFRNHGYVSMTAPSGAHRLFQSPGPKNALGRVKFEFPNPYAVYLHDTPLKNLFARSRRDFSHGCIRVDKALELAETLFRDDGSHYADKMQSVLEGSRQVFVKLSQPVPLSIEYIPVVAAGNGQVIFAGDLYGILQEDTMKQSSVVGGQSSEKTVIKQSLVAGGQSLEKHK